MPARVLVLASGEGTLLQALLDSAVVASGDVRIVAVGSDVADAPALARARSAGVTTFSHGVGDYPDRAAWDEAMLASVAAHSPDFVVCAGFMRILGPAFVDAYPGRVINSHPALLPAFPGTHAVRDALAHGVKVTGCTVHLVDSGVDTGPILAQRAVTVREGEDESTLHERIKQVERELLIETVADFAGQRSLA